MNIDSSTIGHQLSTLHSAEQTKVDKNAQVNGNTVVTSYQKTEELVNSDIVDTDNKKINSTQFTEDIPKEQLEVLAEKLQEFVGSLNKGLQFSVDEDSGRDVIKVIDRETEEIVRQYPSEEVLELVAKLSDAAGNFINSQA
ncbi:flagellar protein FlaG [Psychrobium sp. nBUS_13]|uniref:flagellar protein FlaG n=1 Tax=Psychrobium sp. nBUS_13 TaxID=3395319 RepID=UPI003EB78CFB